MDQYEIYHKVECKYYILQKVGHKNVICAFNQTRKATVYTIADKCLTSSLS